MVIKVSVGAKLRCLRRSVVAKIRGLWKVVGIGS